MSDTIRFYAATDVGRVREHNEDNFLVDKKVGLFVVADGMGGHAAGEVASAIAVRTLHDELKRDKQVLESYTSADPKSDRVTPKAILSLLETAVQAACSRVHHEAVGDSAKRGMGTTLSALLVLGHQGFIAHVGDSRIYLMRNGRVQQVTEDHTVYNELVKRGKLSREQIEKVEQKSAITRAVGVYERVDCDTLVVEVLPGDVFLLASDGLTGYLESPSELEPALGHDDDRSVKELVALANDRGGKDNITALVVRLTGSSPADEARAKRLALKRDVLAKMPLFSRLSERELLRVMPAFEVRTFDDDAVVMREGDRSGDELFIVLKGTVRVERGGARLTELGVGEHFGEMALLRNQPRSATVLTSGPTELIAIRRADFFEILRKEHEIAVKMLWQFLGVLADRLDATSSELRSAREELAAEDVSMEIFADPEPPAPPPRLTPRPTSQPPRTPPRTPSAKPNTSSG